MFFKKTWQALRVSPYPWHYTIRWPLYYRKPSMRNHGRLIPIADEHQSKPTTEQLRILFCGDIMVQHQDKVPNLHPELSQLISDADIFIGNCEAPVADHDLNDAIKYQFNFSMPRSYLNNIMQQTSLPANAWFLSMANNHAGDNGYTGCLTTYALLQSLGISPLGRYNSQTPIQVIEKKGLRLGIAAWTEWMNCEIFPRQDLGVNRRQHIINQDWSNLKQHYHLDYLIGIPHWDYEFQHYPQQQTRALAKKLINDVGFNLIVGMHTHTLQPFEKFANGLCVYSLGNFCGFGSALSIKLIPLLSVQMNLVDTTIDYKLHYFFQAQHDGNTTLLPLHYVSFKEKQLLLKCIKQLFISNYEQH